MIATYTLQHHSFRFLSRKGSIIALKVIACLFTFCMLVSYPPSVAQSVPLDAHLGIEDVKQDTEISYIQLDITTNRTMIEANQLVLIKQGEDLARLDTKMTLIVSFLGLLQFGGIALTVYPAVTNSKKKGE
jgi:hypothetical protein